MTQEIIANNHPFFEECLQLFLLGLANCAIGLHHEAIKDSSDFLDIVNKMYDAILVSENAKAKSVAVSIAGEHELADYPEGMLWQALGCDVDCLMPLSQELVDFARSGENKPTELRYSLIPSSIQLKSGRIEFPSPPIGFKAVDGATLSTLFVMSIAYAVGGAYERFKDQFNRKYGSDSSNWPVELQFFRHLRNGCFHRNQFSIRPKRKGQPQINSQSPPKWRNYVMASENAMNGRTVIGDDPAFFPIVQLLPFLDDMGQFTK